MLQRVEGCDPSDKQEEGGEEDLHVDVWLYDFWISRVPKLYSRMLTNTRLWKMQMAFIGSETNEARLPLASFSYICGP